MFWLARQLQPSANRFRGRFKIQVQEAPFASSILWENMDFSPHTRFFRQCLTALISLALLGIVTGMIFGSKIWQSNVLLADGVTCNAVGHITLPRAHAIHGRGSDASKTEIAALHCYCKNSISSILTDENIKPLCMSWLESFAVSTSVTTLLAIAVVIINIALKEVLLALSRWEKPKSFESEQLSIMYKVLIAQLLNTGLLALALNAKFELPGFGLVGGSDDFDSNWYLSVGSALIMTMLISVFTPLFELVMILIGWIRRKIFWKSKVTQEELNDLYTHKEFQVAHRYGAIFNTLFVTLLYSSGMPILNFLAAGAFIILILLDKVVFLYFSRMPRTYSSVVMRESSRLLYLAITFHLVFAIWMYSSPLLFPSRPVGLDDLPFSLDDYKHNVITLARLVQLTTIGHTVVFGLLIVSFVLFLLWWAVFGNWMRHTSFMKKFDEKPSRAFEIEERRMRKRRLDPSYRMSENPRYREVSRLMEEATARALYYSKRVAAMSPNSIMRAVKEDDIILEEDDVESLSDNERRRQKDFAV